MDQCVADEYKSSLNDLNFNSKPLINMLTMLADDNKKHSSQIVKTIVDHINTVAAESKLPGLYLVDSIIKNVGNQYLKIFCHQIVSLFSSVFEKVDENTRSQMFKLRQTWTDVLPNKILYNLDVSVKKLDPAWPVTAKNPSKKILVNSKSIDGEQSKPDIKCTITKEEDKLKQDELLRQLLAKQEQLRILEMKNLQQTMKKKVSTAGTSAHRSPSKLSLIRDPRVTKINKTPQNVFQKGNTNASQGKATPVHDVSQYISKPILEESAITYVIQVTENEKVPNTNMVKEIATNKMSTSPQTSRLSDLKSLATKSVKTKNEPKISQTSKFSCLKSIAAKIEKTKNEKNISKNKSNFSKVICTDIKNNPNERTNVLNTVESFYNIKIPKKLSNVAKSTQRKKASPDKLSESNSNTHLENNKKGDKQLKMSRKCEKSEVLHTESSDDVNRVNIRGEISVDNSADSENIKFKQNVPTGLIEGLKTIEFADKMKDSLNTGIQFSDTKSDLIKDEDQGLKNNSTAVNDIACFKVPKREVQDVESANDEGGKSEPPKKKIKSKDVENLNPDHSYRKSDSPVLFGNEDQDLRKIEKKLPMMNELNSYSESIVVPVKQENTDGHSKLWKQHPLESTNFCQLEYDRYRSSRQRYNSRFGRYRRPAFRFRGQYMYTSKTGSVRFNPSTALQQAKERFNSGKMSENEYTEICHGLQKMLDSNYQHFHKSTSKLQNIQNQKNPDNCNIIQAEKLLPIEPVENIWIQGPSVSLPPVKPFVLDNKNMLIYFVEDKALILMENGEPKELTFKAETREVYIDGRFYLYSETC